jgi:hypothetical protein
MAKREEKIAAKLARVVATLPPSHRHPPSSPLDTRPDAILADTRLSAHRVDRRLLARVVDQYWVMRDD